MKHTYEVMNIRLFLPMVPETSIRLLKTLMAVRLAAKQS